MKKTVVDDLDWLIRRANDCAHLAPKTEDREEARELLKENHSFILAARYIANKNKEWPEDRDELQELYDGLCRWNLAARSAFELPGLEDFFPGVAYIWREMDRRFSTFYDMYQRVEQLLFRADDRAVSSISRGSSVSNFVKRQPITPDLRADVWDKSRGVCWYCGVELHPFRNYHVDHFIPVIDGGSNEIANLVPCCQPCNSRKHARPAEYLRRFIGSGVFWFEKEGKA